MATYYIDPAGDDNTGNGTIGNPWRSLYKACNVVAGYGDIIHVNAGTYTETSRSLLSVNVSIEGEGTGSTTIYHHYANLASYEAGLLIQFGSNTAQHVSGITFDGDTYQGYQGIAVYQRSNVSIYNVVVRNFYIKGILFGSGASVLSYNNSIHDCQIINSGSQGPSGNSHYPNLYLSRQVNFRCYNNVITQTGRSVNQNGNGVSGYEACYGMKFYNNTITVAPYLYDEIWKFAIELWYQQGLEMYGNTVKGEVDFGKDLIKGSYDYGLYFHNNTVGWDSLVTHRSNGIQLEQTIEDTIICRNTFKNLDNAVWMTQYNYADDYVENLSIHTNLIYNCGVDGSTSSVPAIFFESGTHVRPRYYNNVQIYNNTIVAHADHPSAYGIELPTHASEGAPAYIDVRNNIIVGFGTAGVIARQQNGSFTPAIDHLTLHNNVIYDCGNSNNYVTSGVTLTNDDIDTPIKSDPLFAYAPTDLHLESSSSSAYRAGQDVGLLTDYDNKPWNNPPSIGAYEYGLVSVTTLKGSTSLTFSCRAGTPELTQECVPDRPDFTLQDVVRVVQPSEDTLQACFDAAIEEYFDPLYYDGVRDRLSKFRNYCIRRTYLQAAGSTSLTFSCTATGAPEKYLYGSTSLTFGCTATGQVSAGKLCYPNWGYVYNWYAMADARGLANTGYHVITKDEWEDIHDILGYESMYFLINPDLWPDYDDPENCTNEYGFDLGYKGNDRGADGVFGNGGGYDYSMMMGTASELDETRGYAMEVYGCCGDIYDQWRNKKNGYPVRIVKDSTDLEEYETGSYTGNDGKTYQTVCVAGYEVTTSNIAETKYYNGDTVPEVIPNDDWAALTTGAWSMYDGVESYYEYTCGDSLIKGSTSLRFTVTGNLIDKPTPFNTMYGGLYNWYAMSDPRHILSEGWSIPAHGNFITLSNYIGPPGSYLGGGKLKETGFTHWDSPNEGATNEMAFTGLGAGMRYGVVGEGEFAGLKGQLFMWASTVNPECWTLDYLSDYFADAYYGDEAMGFSIRPVKNSTTLSHGQTGFYTGNDGKVYPTICIGTQEWLAVNLCETKYRNGDVIPAVTDSIIWSGLTTDARCCYDNNSDNCGSEVPIPQIRTTSGSTSLTFTASGKTPPATYPAELHAVQLGAGLEINVDWEAVTDATGYLLQRIPQNYNGVWIPNWKSIYSGSNLTFADHIEDEGVMVDDTHVTYRIFAYNDSGYGPMSPEYVAHWYA